MTFVYRKKHSRSNGGVRPKAFPSDAARGWVSGDNKITKADLLARND